MSELIVFRKLPTVCVTSLRASLSQPLVMVTVSDAPLFAKAPSTFCALLTPSVANASTLLPDGVSFSLNSPTLLSALFDGVKKIEYNDFQNPEFCAWFFAECSRLAYRPN